MAFQVENDFREMIQKYCSHDVKDLVARYMEEMAEGATVGGRPVPRAKSNNSELLPKQIGR